MRSVTCETRRNNGRGFDRDTPIDRIDAWADEGYDVGMGIRGTGIAKATLRELYMRSSRVFHAGRRRMEASKALVDACRLIIDLEREERTKLMADTSRAR